MGCNAPISSGVHPPRERWTLGGSAPSLGGEARREPGGAITLPPKRPLDTGEEVRVLGQATSYPMHLDGSMAAPN